MISRQQVGRAYLRFQHDDARRWHFPALVLALTIIAESLIVLGSAQLGALLHVVVLLALLYSHRQAEDEANRHLRTAMLFVPLLRVLSLALLLADWPPAISYSVVSIIVLAGVMLAVRLEHWPREAIGLTARVLPVQLALGLSGLGLGWVAYRILAPDAIIPGSWQPIWLLGLVLAIGAAFVEELVFRGLLQSAAMRVMGYWPAILFVAALYGAMHIGYSSPLFVLFAFAVGCLLGTIVAGTRSLLGATLAHGLANFCLFQLWPYWLN